MREIFVHQIMRFSFDFHQPITLEETAQVPVFFSSSAREMINECLHCLLHREQSCSEICGKAIEAWCKSFVFSSSFTRYTIFDSKQMPPSAQQSSSASLLMLSQNQQQPQPTNMMHNPLSPPPIPMLPSMDVLSVSSKKLCSYCNHELGSGAAMIIENLGLFYHINCFKCSVCQTPISDGNIHGTDVRVRNSRLHCHNCFSNEEGVKFSCVWLINLQVSFPSRARNFNENAFCACATKSNDDQWIVKMFFHA